MCLSAPVSFAASVFLVGGGTAISVVAWRRNKRYFPIALMPLFAGLQQFMEGSVWLGMTGDDPFTVLWGAMGFIFFTWFMWPVWIPFSVYALEPNDSPRKRMFLIMSLIGLILPPALSHYKHVRHFALTLIAVVVVDFAFLQFAYISFFCLLAGLATLHLVYIILTNKCARECPELFGRV